jgi:uncharacterized membrane protein
MGMSQRNLAGNNNRAAFLIGALALLLLAGGWSSSSNLWAQAVTQAPAVSATPDGVYFGTQVIGTTGGSQPVIQSVTLKNKGNAPLEISKIGLTGDFSQKNDCPATLPAGASCKVDISFLPGVNGVRNGTLEFTDNASDSPQDVMVQGTGMIVDLVHIHLLLNHFPIIGTIIGVCLFLIALIGKSEDLQRASLVIFLGMSLVALPTFMTGNAAQDAIKYLPGVSLSLLAAHQNAALLALVFMEITGAAAWFGLWEYRRNSKLGSVTLGVVLILSLITIGTMGNAGNLGGKIRHEEIMHESEIAATSIMGTQALGLDAAKIGTWVRGTKWVWPTLQTLHFIGLSLLLGVVFLVDLRLLGAMKNTSYSAVHRLLPWGVMGFALNVLTGLCYWVAAPYQYTLNPVFYWKIMFIMAAGINAIYLTLFDEPWSVQAGQAAPLRGKLIAASVVLLWIGVIFCGIMLPFLGSAF